MLPALAVGASLVPAVTVMVTVSETRKLCGSVTVSLKTSTALVTSCVGAVKLALAEVELAMLTDGAPDECSHR